MEVILLEKVANLGDLGDRVTVKAGYGRNFLIPQNKAVPATSDNIEVFEQRRAELQARADEALAAAETRATALRQMTLTISAKAGEEGKLYGSVGNRDIADAAQAAGLELQKSEVRMPQGPIRELGEYEIDVHLHSAVDCMLKVVVAAE